MAFADAYWHPGSLCTLIRCTCEELTLAFGLSYVRSHNRIQLMVVYHIRENFQVFESMRIAFPALMAQGNLITLMTCACVPNMHVSCVSVQSSLQAPLVSIEGMKWQLACSSLVLP